VVVSAHLVDERHAVISVRDRGIGIAPDQLDRIFGRFERAVSERAFPGMGLGLYIVRQFVEAHGGQVRVESRVGEGSTFTIELPRG
jgi:signal transduction histidine kinase